MNAPATASHALLLHGGTLVTMDDAKDRKSVV